MQECNNTAPQQVVPQLKMRTSLRSGATTGGGWVNSVFYQDMSGYCSGTTPPPTNPPTTPPTNPPTTGGGWINGVFYPDMSGYCSV